jgi:hypothetical protein
VADFDAAPTGGGGRPVFVDDAGRRARIVRPVAAAAGALVTAFILMVGGSLFGAPGVPRLSLGLPRPDPGTTRVAVRPAVPNRAVPGAVLLASGPSSGAASAGAALGTRPPRPGGSGGAPVTTTAPAPVATAPSMTATTLPARSSTSPAATRGPSHKKASTATTTTTGVAPLR